MLVEVRRTEQGLEDRPMYFISSNAHSIVNLVTGYARSREGEIISWVEAAGPDTAGPR